MGSASIHVQVWRPDQAHAHLCLISDHWRSSCYHEVSLSLLHSTSYGIRVVFAQRPATQPLHHHWPALSLWSYAQGCPQSANSRRHRHLGSQHLQLLPPETPFSAAPTGPLFLGEECRHQHQHHPLRLATLTSWGRLPPAPARLRTHCRHRCLGRRYYSAHRSDSSRGTSS